MTPNPYRNAYEAAIEELGEISARFEQLRTRKGQIENLIVALQPVFGSHDSRTPEVSVAVNTDEAARATETSETLSNTTEETEPPAGYSYMDVPNPLPESEGDPFQRRVRTSFRFKGLAAQRSF